MLNDSEVYKKRQIHESIGITSKDQNFHKKLLIVMPILIPKINRFLILITILNNPSSHSIHSFIHCNLFHKVFFLDL